MILADEKNCPFHGSITNSPFVFPYISYRGSGEKLLKYQ